MRQILVYLILTLVFLSAAVAQTSGEQNQTQPGAQPQADKNAAQNQSVNQPSAEARPPAQLHSATRQVTLPAGTRVLLQLQSPIYTKTAHVGDGVYCESTFPVTQDNQLAIPAGTYVKGKVTRIERPGRVKGRAELQVYFTTMIFPNGYTVDLPGALDSTPGAENHEVIGDEGTVRATGTKGHDAGTVAKTAGAGATIGALSSRTLKGTGLGGAIGTGVGLASVLLTRGPDVRLDRGTTVEMVLQRPLTVEVTENYQRQQEFRPRSGVDRRLPPLDRQN
jgi:type IV secretion system protein VirB10